VKKFVADDSESQKFEDASVEAQLCVLREQMHELHQEVKSLRRQRWAGAGLLMSGLLLLSLPYAYTQNAAGTSESPASNAVPAPLQDITCRSLQIIGKDGKTAMILGSGERGAYLSMRGQNGRSQVGLSVAQHGGLLELYGQNGKTQLLHGVNRDGGVTRLFAKNGQLRLESFVMAHGGQLLVNGAGDKQGFSAGVSANNTGLVQIMDKNGETRALLGVVNGTGAIAVMDSKGKIVKTLP
jgi:hypothetical protein